MQSGCGLDHWAFLTDMGVTWGETPDNLTIWATSHLDRPIQLIRAATAELPDFVSSFVTMDQGYVLVIREDLDQRSQSEEAAHHLAHALISDHPDRAAYETPDAATTMPHCSWD